MGEERLEVALPSDLVKRMDELIELLGFRSREEFVSAAVRRLVDQYTAIAVKGR